MEAWQHLLNVHGVDQVAVSIGGTSRTLNSFQYTWLGAGGVIQSQYTGTIPLHSGQSFPNNGLVTTAKNAAGTTALLMGYPSVGSVFTLVQLDASGGQRWAAPLTDAWDLALDEADNCYVAGRENVGGTLVATLRKYSSSGQLQWSRTTSPLLPNAVLRRVLPVPGGDVVAIGMRPNSGYVIIRVSPAGTVLWSTELAVANVRSLREAQVDAQGNVVLLGSAALNRAPGGFRLTKCSAQGQLLWHTTYLTTPTNGSLDGCPMFLRLDAAGNAYVAGMRQQGWGYTLDYVTAKYDGGGLQQWARLAAAGNRIDSVRGFTVDAQGNACLTGDNNSGVLLLRYAPDGSIVWNGRYLPNGSTWATGREIEFDPAGNVYLRVDQGPSTNTTQGQSDLVVMKLPAVVNTTKKPTHQLPLGLWPNPARDQLRVQVPPGGRYLELHNALGQLVRREALRPGSTAELSLRQLPAGVYHVRIHAPDGVYTQRLVKQ